MVTPAEQAMIESLNSAIVAATAAGDYGAANDAYRELQRLNRRISRRTPSKLDKKTERKRSLRFNQMVDAEIEREARRKAGRGNEVKSHHYEEARERVMKKVGGYRPVRDLETGELNMPLMPTMPAHIPPMAAGPAPPPPQRTLPYSPLSQMTGAGSATQMRPPTPQAPAGPPAGPPTGMFGQQLTQPTLDDFEVLPSQVSVRAPAGVRRQNPFRGGTVAY